MICSKCGAAVGAGEASCPLCGAPAVPGEPAPEPSPFARLLGAEREDAVPLPLEPSPPDAPPPVAGALDAVKADPAPSPAGRHRPNALIFGLGAALLLVVAAVFAVPAAIEALSPAAQVAAALGRTLDALSAPYRELGLDEVFAAASRGPVGQELSYSVSSGTLNGFGLRLETDVQSRRAAMAASLNARGRPALSLHTFLEDDLLSFTSPELLNGQWYALHTGSIGRDYNASALYDGYSAMEEDFGFDLFDGEGAGMSEETRAALAALWKEYSPAVTVERTERGVPVADGWALTGDCYRLTFPAQALRDYVRQAAYTLLEDDAARPSVLAVLSRLANGYAVYYAIDGWPERSGEAYDAVDRAVEGITQDLELRVWIADGLARRLTADFSYTAARGGQIRHTFSLLIGDETQLARPLHADLTIADARGERSRISLELVGGRAPEDGVYNSAAALDVTARTGNSRLMCYVKYDPNSPAGNFSLTMLLSEDSFDSFSLACTGRVLIDPGAGTLSADLMLDAPPSSSDGLWDGLAVHYSFFPITEFSLQPEDPILFFSLSREEYTQFYDVLSENLTAFSRRL